LVSRRGCDVVLSRSLPLYGHLPALIVSRRLKIPWIANWNDPAPLEKMPPPYGKGPQAKLSYPADRLLRAAALGATWHTFPCERLRRYVCSYLPGRLLERSSVIPHIALDRFQNRAPGHRRACLSLCYAGNLGPQRQPHVLLQGLREFVHRRPAARVNLTFISNRPDEVMTAARSLHVAQMVHAEAARPYVDTLAAMREHDVLVVIEGPLKEGIFLPSKLVDCAQLTRPVLALSPAVGTVRDMLSETGGGIVVDCQSPAQVTEALGILHDHWSAGTLDSAFRLWRLREVFSESRVLEEYLRLIHLVVTTRNGPRRPSSAGERPSASVEC